MPDEVRAPLNWTANSLSRKLTLLDYFNMTSLSCFKLFSNFHQQNLGNPGKMTW